MNQRIKAIVEEARKLTPEERLELFDMLDATFQGDEGDGTPEEVEAAWLEVVEERIATRERGETVSVSHDKVLAELRALIKRS